MLSFRLILAQSWLFQDQIKIREAKGAFPNGIVYNGSGTSDSVAVFGEIINSVLCTHAKRWHAESLVS